MPKTKCEDAKIDFCGFPLPDIYADLPLNWNKKSGSDQQKNLDLGEKIEIMVK